MKHALETVLIPFPAGLMSSARTPATMPTNFARDILNMYVAEDGAGKKRNGFSIAAPEITGENITKLLYHIPQAGGIQVLAATGAGNIYLYDNANNSWQLKHSGLNVNGVIRSTHFAGKLVICNGVDPLLAYDGTAFSAIFEYVPDASSGLTYIAANQFSINGEAALYSAGTKIEARLGAGTFVQGTVASVSGTEPITVTLNENVLTADLDQMAYAASPPTFSYIYAAHDRLWGIGKGLLTAAGYGANVDRNRVFYTFGVNDETAWHDSFGGLQSINLEDKMPVIDELVAMAVKDGFTAFFFRNTLQLYSGVNPTITGDFAWVKTIPLGAIHGDLVMEMPNDIGFLTRYGARTLSRVLQTEQLDVGDFGSEIDPSLSAAVNTMLSSDAAYRQASSFKFDKQGWFGFKPAGDALVFQAQGVGVGWARFDGLFNSASAFLNTPDGKLYVAAGGSLFCYDETSYSDNGAPIATRWWMPWLSLTQNFKRWGNKYAEVITDQGANLLIRLKRYKNYDSSSFRENSLTSLVAADYWDEAEFDISLWDNGAPRPGVVRDTFVADTFSYALETENTQGPLTFFGVKLHGLRER